MPTAVRVVVSVLVLATAGSTSAQQQVSGRELLEDIRALRALNQLSLSGEQCAGLSSALATASQDIANASEDATLLPEQLAALRSVWDTVLRGREPSREDEAAAISAIRALEEAQWAIERARWTAARSVAGILNNYQIDRLQALDIEMPQERLRELAEEAERRKDQAFELFKAIALPGEEEDEPPPIEELAERLVRGKYGERTPQDTDAAMADAVADLAEVEAVGPEELREQIESKVRAWAPDMDELRREELCARALDFFLRPRVTHLMKLAAAARQSG